MGRWEKRGLRLYPAKTFKSPCDSGDKNNWSDMHIPGKKQLYTFNEGIFVNYNQQNFKKKGGCRYGKKKLSIMRALEIKHPEKWEFKKLMVEVESQYRPETNLYLCCKHLKNWDCSKGVV